MEDEQIMQEVRAGNVGKLEALFDRHHRALFRYFVRLTSDRSWSEDLVQEVFFRILKYTPSAFSQARSTAVRFGSGLLSHLYIFLRFCSALSITSSRR